jgi:hypothetical protein
MTTERKAKPLSPTQQELLAAMLRGVRVLHLSGINAHYFRTDNHKSVSTTVDALVKRGMLLREFDKYGKATVRLA